MSTPEFPKAGNGDFDDVIDVGPPSSSGRRWKLWSIVALIVLIIVAFNAVSIYVEALWFGSLGFASVYWYTLRLQILLFIVFAILTAIILRGAFFLLERVFATSALEKRVVVINNQPVTVAPARVVRPLAWIVSIIFSLIYGLGMKDEWQAFVLYFNQTSTSGADPIFGKPPGFYLFTLPVYESVTSWLSVLAFIILCATVVFALLSIPQKLKTTAAIAPARRTAFASISIALAALMILIAAQVFLSRYPYLWEDHSAFSGVTFTEANYLLPGLSIVAAALILAALVAIANAFTQRRLRLLIISIAVPIAVYIVACVIIPGYVTNFIVKPNQLGRETPYIKQNIEWTRRGFGLDNVEERTFDAEPTVAALKINDNRETLDNIRLWDWRALQATLKQIQQIRTYYEFPDVDVDRYHIGGATKQVMIAPRELDVNDLPEQSRNWVNERLIYTHGYGVTMNTSNGFTPEGMPQFILSNMPIESTSPDIKVTRPEIYFGQTTNTDVYVKTRQKEFDYPQGEANTTTVYQGKGGIPIGSGLRRMVIAWALGDLSKLPFSDDVAPDSLVLMKRNINERVRELAPFLIFDNDPYIVVTNDGKLVWLIDAFTESANYPYSRHHDAAGKIVNYMRNSVKVSVDAYDGSVKFYVFDPQDPIINTYRAAFPALFVDASSMPEDLRAHIRYPETLIRTQGEVYGLYHTQDAQVFFQRQDVWSVARQHTEAKDKKEDSAPLEPYFVLMQLPGEDMKSEFVEIVPFTPVSRNNLIGWMAGRSDGAYYGSLIVYDFPTSRLVDGPLQIDARIDQNAAISSQLTLWNQQGSQVLRGSLLVIPIGNGLLYVKPIYLQAVSSPMPELRIVVLSTQERLAYGATFAEAITNLFGSATSPATPPATSDTSAQPGPPAQTPPSTSAPPTPAVATQQLINQAAQQFDDYQRLTKEGKFGEAGQKLEALRQTLEELKRSQGGKR